MDRKALTIPLEAVVRHLGRARHALWALTSLVVLLAVLLAGPGKAFAIAPEPIDAEPREPGDVPDHFTWSMLSRFGQDSNGDGIIDYHYDQTYVNPSTFTVRFNGCPALGTTGIRYAWEIDGASTGNTACGFNRDLAPGSHHVKFTATPLTGPGTVYEEDIVVRDILIVSLGDSFASGEGNPDIPQQYNWLGNTTDVAQWVDRRCHRSAYAGPAQAALAIEQRDPHTSVTFVSLACSGAKLTDLISAGYMGPEPGQGDPPLDAQLNVLRSIVGSRRIDALVISGGGNDLGFANIIANCVAGLACQNDPQLLNQVAHDLQQLPGLYQLVNDWIVNGPDGIDGPEAGIPVSHVYYTEYPNPVHDADGSVCDYMVGDILWPLSINKDEATWAERSVFQPLNSIMHQAVDAAPALDYGIDWNFVGGVADAFAGPGYGHGYCAGDQAWIRTASDSVYMQGPSLGWPDISIWDQMHTTGTMHPTYSGHQVYRQRLLTFLLPDLFPGQTLPDGPSFSHAGSSGSDTDQMGNNGWVTGTCSGVTCVSDRGLLEVVASDPAGISSTSVAVDGVPACDASSVSGVTCTAQAVDAQHYGWHFDITAEGIHRLEFAVRNGNGQVANFTQEFKLDLTDPTAAAVISAAVPGTAGWYTAPVSVTLGGTDAAGGLGLGSGLYRVHYTLDGVPGDVSAGQAVSVATDGVHTLAYRSMDLAGRQSVTQTLTVKVDMTPPALTCATPDGLWHAGDVALACTASDSASGLAKAADAAFTLSTGVAAGSETADAATDSRTVCDLAGNCATAGPTSGNMVDRKVPSITLTTPANMTYVLGQAVAASYSCADGGSGVASCAGPVANGSPFDTASTGTKSFAVNAADNVGNAASQSASYAVTYNLCVLYDQIKAHKAGSTVPIKLQLCDAAGANASTAAVVISATGLTKQDSSASSDVEDSGQANPDNNFRFDPTLGGYIYNLSTSGMSTGTWVLSFTTTGDPITHTVHFDVK